MSKELIIVGDRVLVEPDKARDRNEHGLYLPQGVKEKEKVQSGTVIKTGPGYPIPDPNSFDSEPWAQKENKEKKYFPLQAIAGDHCVFLRNAGIEMQYEDQKYIIVPHSAILVLVRGGVIENAISKMLKTEKGFDKK